MRPDKVGAAAPGAVVVLWVTMMLLLFGQGTASAAGALDAADPWFGRDKALHFSFSAVIAGGGYAGTAALTDDRRWRIMGGVGLGLLAGASKEALDATGSGDPSWRDFTWDVVGTATGVAVAAFVDWLLTK
ncbi:MAG: hypothetical protein ABJA82_03645 [Myxococcales bacterium]